MFLLLADGAAESLYDLDFTSGSLPDGVTFARASSGKYLDSSNVLQTAGTDIARFEYGNTLLYEPQATNLHKYSFPVTSEWEGNITEDDAEFIDGNTVASRIEESTSAEPQFARYRFVDVVSGTTYTHRAIVKKGTATILQLSFITSAFGAGYVNYNLSTGVVTASSGVVGSAITDLSGGWYELTVTATAVGDSGNGGVVLVFTNDNPTAGRLPNYTGTGKTAFVGGVGCEEGTEATSIIYTDGATVTRAADQLTITDSGLTSGLRVTFDDDSTQDIESGAAPYLLTNTLDRYRIKGIDFIDVGGDSLLLESGDYVLLESGDKILLEGSP